jgi:hypothetical protein
MLHRHPSTTKHRPCLTFVSLSFDVTIRLVSYRPLLLPLLAPSFPLYSEQRIPIHTTSTRSHNYCITFTIIHFTNAFPELCRAYNSHDFPRYITPDEIGTASPPTCFPPSLSWVFGTLDCCTLDCNNTTGRCIYSMRDHARTELPGHNSGMATWDIYGSAQRRDRCGFLSNE